VDGVSCRHAEGWAFNPANPTERVDVEIVLATTGEVLADTRADLPKWGLTIGDGRHAFYIRFQRELTAEERPLVRVRTMRDGADLPISAEIPYEPILFVAGDIVDNCNLRCPFCLYDYANTNRTTFMSEETIDAALRFLPYTTDGNFWFSCLHEPTLHPQLMAYIDKVPPEYRRRLFYTTNLAKRMPEGYFSWLAETAMHHINVSIESRDPAIYERMRKGARHRIFMENWDKLVAAFRNGSAPPKLRYIAMAYKSNLRELPELVKYLLEERNGSQIELRYTFDELHIDPAFKAAEFLEPDDWRWLRDELAHYPSDKLQMEFPLGLVLPPVGSNELPPASVVAAPTLSIEKRLAAAFLRGRYSFRLSADGTLQVNRALSDYGITDPPVIKTLNVRDIADVERFIAELPY
jgi:sulfatase maturation enzyme AslB (radical SAM superfamily)